MLNSATLTYYDDDIELEGFYAYQHTKKQSPVVLIVHDWTGKNEFAIKKAEQLAELGYVGFAIDMYGKGKLGKTKEEKSALIQPFMKDRQLLQKRILAAFDAVKKISVADQHNIAAIGFCFGGLCALDLARSGADVKAVVSFHGLFVPPENLPAKKISAKILALHGFDDPMVTHDQVIALGEELTKAKADWEINMYGHAMHAFTNPEANDPAFGTVYNKKSDSRAWIAMQHFLQETFGVS